MSLLLASAIPFREEASTSTTMVLFAFGVTAAVLGLFVVVAVIGRNRGWWKRWSIPAASSGHASEPLVVEQMLPLSRETRVYVLRRGNERWLLSESARSTSFTSIAPVLTGPRDAP